MNKSKTKEKLKINFFSSSTIIYEIISFLKETASVATVKQEKLVDSKLLLEKALLAELSFRPIRPISTDFLLRS
jgi:hypothetical protein